MYKYRLLDLSYEKYFFYIPTEKIPTQRSLENETPTPTISYLPQLSLSLLIMKTNIVKSEVTYNGKKRRTSRQERSKIDSVHRSVLWVTL